MKSLKESLLADIEDTLAAGDDNIKDVIFKFLCENYHITNIKDLVFKQDKTGKYLVSINHDTVIKPSSKIKQLTNGLFEFDYIAGYFSIDESEIETLEGGPKKIKGWFDCQSCNNLKTLEHMPTNATEVFCTYCENLISLKGCPKRLYNFNCTGCNSLKDLSNGPKEVLNDYICSHCENLESLKGCATMVGNNFECSYCNKLKSINYCPKKVGGNFSCWQDVEENGGIRFEEADIKAICKVGYKIKGAKNW
jgi:hypothetical protein